MGFVHCPDRDERDERCRELRSLGLSLREIGAVVGCSYSTVREAVDRDLKTRMNAKRAARNTSPVGLQRQRDYRARNLNVFAPRIVERLRATGTCRACGKVGPGETTLEHRGFEGDHLRYHFCDECLGTFRAVA